MIVFSISGVPEKVWAMMDKNIRAETIKNVGTMYFIIFISNRLKRKVSALITAKVAIKLNMP